MINDEIADIIYKMSIYVEMNDDKSSFFQSRALRKGADVISEFPYDFALPEWHLDIDKLTKIEGIGKKIASYINEYVTTGKISEYERLKKESPIKLEELLHIQGLGPKKIKRLYNELGVTDIESLKVVAKKGLIAKLSGFGEKSQANILENIEFAIVNKDRISIALADNVIADLLLYLKKDKNIIQIEPAGSYRRRKETVGDLDILISSKNPEKTIKHFVSYEKVEKILGEGKTKASVWLKQKLQCDLRVVDNKSFGAALQYFTGSKEHNISIRKIAVAKGYKLSEYGLFNRNTNELIESKSETVLYNKLELSYIEPELRIGDDEIIAAKNSYALKNGKVLKNSPTLFLPKLVKLSDIKKDLHMHTVFSDGKNTVFEMAMAAIKLGYSKIGISDHIGNLVIANPIKDENRFKKYLKTIREANESIKGIEILASGEVEVDVNGNLEFPNELLSQLDYVIAGIHMSTSMNKDTMTKRIINVLKNPNVKILAHPTGRLIGKRPPYEFDFNEVCKVAREEGVALEINAHPNRLDLNSRLVRKAKDLGCKISINTDAHSTDGLLLMKYGIDVARGGWITKVDLFDL